ncbi:MAG: hypothetical protein ACRCV9_09165 [Burkholderiaceae bacterium]
MRALARAAALGLLLVWQLDGLAATRCEDAAGKVTYVEGACPAGTKSVREVGKAAAPPVTEQTTAVNRASQEYKDAERLRIAREKQETKQANANAAAKKRDNAQAKKCERLAVRVKRAKEDEKSVTP